MSKNSINYCNNCGKSGHLFHNCKMPIMSLGAIALRYNDGVIEYLMIRRKETLGYIDFMRGKYPINDVEYISNMLNQMTNEEKHNILHKDFDELWIKIWGNEGYNNKYKMEETSSKEKFNNLREGNFGIEHNTLKTLLDNIHTDNEWTETEWGFPKGRRNYQENDYDCAVREFCEETGYKYNVLNPIQNVVPYEETFMGSNYKSYKHKYFLMYMKYADTIDVSKFQKSEVSKMEWFSVDQCLDKIRSYNLEKQDIIRKVDSCLKKMRLYRL